MFPQFKHCVQALIIALRVAVVVADSDRWSALLTLTSALIYLGFSALVWLAPAALVSALTYIAFAYVKELRTAMSGYANRVITIPFEHLTEPGEKPVHVVIRNPRLMPPGELVPRQVQVDDAGNPVDLADAKRANDEMMAKIIIGWHAFDATNFSFGEDGELLPQTPLPLPPTADLVAKLPMEIYKAVTDEITAAINPQ